MMASFLTQRGGVAHDEQVSLVVSLGASAPHARASANSRPCRRSRAAGVRPAEQGVALGSLLRQSEDPASVGIPSKGGPVTSWTFATRGATRRGIACVCALFLGLLTIVDLAGCVVTRTAPPPRGEVIELPEEAVSYSTDPSSDEASGSGAPDLETEVKAELSRRGDEAV